MPYIRIWIHLIWATKQREKIITRSLKPKLLAHMRENAKRQKIYIDFLNCTADHIHITVSVGGMQSVSRIVRLLKGESSHWVNENNLSKLKFEWQDDYIALSVSESQIDRVREYIRKQEEHHRRKNFDEEYREFLEKFGFIK